MLLKFKMLSYVNHKVQNALKRHQRAHIKPIRNATIQIVKSVPINEYPNFQNWSHISVF